MKPRESEKREEVSRTENHIRSSNPSAASFSLLIHPSTTLMGSTRYLAS